MRSITTPCMTWWCAVRVPATATPPSATPWKARRQNATWSVLTSPRKTHFSPHHMQMGSVQHKLELIKKTRSCWYRNPLKWILSGSLENKSLRPIFWSFGFFLIMEWYESKCSLYVVLWQVSSTESFSSCIKQIRSAKYKSYK